MIHEGVGQSTMELSLRRPSAEDVIQQKGVTWQKVSMGWWRVDPLLSDRVV